MLIFGVQVELLGKWLSREKFTRIYSSDYPRALDTGRAILAHNLSATKLRLEIQHDSRLRERVCYIVHIISLQTSV